MFDRNGRVWDFERARQIVADKNPDNEEWIEEVAAQFRLSRNWTKILKAVGIDWPTKNLPAFRSRLSEIAMNESASVTERAMACEMLASSYSAGLAEADPEKYREWSNSAMSALDSSETRDEDYFAILASTTLGLVDQGLETLTDEDLLETVTWMIDNGAFNAPNRVRVHFGNDRALFERLIARADSGEPHAFNLYYLDKARKKMAELSMT